VSPGPAMPMGDRSHQDWPSKGLGHHIGGQMVDKRVRIRSDGANGWRPWLVRIPLSSQFRKAPPTTL
jgi:hypothetical protein